MLAALLLTVLTPQSQEAQAERLITTDSIAAPLRFLSHDLLEGRGVASRGDQLARLYIGTQLQSLGLVVEEQAVPVLGITSNVTETLTLKGTKGELSLAGPTDFTAVASCRAPETSWDGAEVVFVGYGIEAKEQRWDDFKGADLKGKVLLVMNNDPSSDPQLFAGKTRLYYGRWSYKYEEAARRGAVGAIVIHTEVSAGYPFHVIQSRHGKEEFFLPFSKTEPALRVRAWCSEDAARRICAHGGQDLDALRSKAETREFAPVPLGVRAHLLLENTIRELMTANVVGKLAGSDPSLASEAVVVTAHFDHLGIGPAKKGDTIYNGALDNASGSAAMLALARACASLEPRPRRSLYFVGCTGEESGLFGSQWFATHLPIPRRKVIADFNIDGINIWGATKDLQMIGYGKNTLSALAQEIAGARGRLIEPDSQPDLGLFYRSDHFSFARVGIPSAYFKAGDQFLENREGKARIKAMFTTVHYHQPSDEYDARWNLTGAVEDTRLVLACLLRTANDANEPRWTPGDEFEKLRDAPEPMRDGDFLRFVGKGPDEGTLEVALPTYVNDAGARVTLISAVHIADLAHYAALDEEFRRYDAMLYELVAPPGTLPERNSRDTSALSLIQRALKNGLQLAFQLDGVDYKAKNFVHADLSPQEFAAQMKERGESILTIVWNMMLAGIAQGSTASPESVDLVKAFRNNEGRHKMRLSLARQFDEIERMSLGLGAGKNGSTLLEGRNQKAVEVLQQQLALGKKTIAIYYGAAHMPDMERRLTTLGFKKESERWLVAWDVTKRPDK